MKKYVLIILVALASFAFGYSLKQPVIEAPKRVTGIGGVFFKCKDPKAVKEWYSKHLGMEMDQYGCGFEWREGEDSTKYGFTQWSTFKETTKYFLPSAKDFMINYRVKDLDWLVKELKEEGVTICDTIVRSDYGNFVHIMDNEGNKIELWQPVAADYNEVAKKRMK
jgi:predicted enzyme related to lactoylglutathione lyase